MSRESNANPNFDFDFDPETETLSPSLEAFLSRASASRHQLAALPPNSSREDQTYKVPESYAGDRVRQGLPVDSVGGSSSVTASQHSASVLHNVWGDKEDWSPCEDEVDGDPWSNIPNSSIVGKGSSLIATDSSVDPHLNIFLPYLPGDSSSNWVNKEMLKRKLRSRSKGIQDDNVDPLNPVDFLQWTPVTLPQVLDRASLAGAIDLSKKAGDRVLSYTISEDLTDPDQVRKKRLRALEDLRNRKKAGKGTSTTNEEEETESAMEEVD